MKNTPTHSGPAKLLLVLALLASAAAIAAPPKTSFEDTFAKDDSAHYEIQGGEWAYDAERHCFTMAKALDRNNETMSALRTDVTLPRAFTFEAEFTADGSGGGGLLLMDHSTGHYAYACLGLGKAEEGGWWVVAWIIYSYPETKWGYLRQTKKFVPDLADFTFTLQLTRAPGSDVLEFIAFNSEVGTLETTLAPGSTGDEGNELLPSWVETLNSFTQAGLRGYDSKGSWSRIKLTELK